MMSIAQKWVIAYLRIGCVCYMFNFLFIMIPMFFRFHSDTLSAIINFISIELFPSWWASLIFFLFLPKTGTWADMGLLVPAGLLASIVSIGLGSIFLISMRQFLNGNAWAKNMCTIMLVGALLLRLVYLFTDPVFKSYLNFAQLQPDEFAVAPTQIARVALLTVCLNVLINIKLPRNTLFNS